MNVTNTLKLGGNFLVRSYQMFSASAEAEKAEHTIHIGKRNHIFLVGTGKDKASKIYVSGEPGSDGFGGRTIKFPLAQGIGTVELKGPWHTNADHLKAETGIDLTKEHLTFGVIGRGRKGGLKTVITDLVYFDKDFTAGTHNRIESLANQLSEKFQETLAYYCECKGGSSSGFVNYNKFSK